MLLQDISSTIYVIESSDCVAFIHSKIDLLAPKYLFVNIYLDEAKPMVHYKVDKILGHAAN